MCGIVGFLNRNGKEASSHYVGGMIDAISHRGPDARGVYSHENLALGHVRLSVIDLSHLANQPMSTEDGRYTVVYNGEIYNYRELKFQLEGKGHKFTSQSDTEVLLRAYIEWGSDCVVRFNGMFAFAVFDSAKQSVFFARDRFGIKPLYYGELGGVFLFGSEIKAIEQHPEYDFSVNNLAIKEYFCFQNFLSDQTFNENIQMFPAGYFGTLSLKGTSDIEMTQYWNFDFQEPENQASEAEYCEELDRLFQQAIKRQMVADVPLGSYLSGGIDSGSITAISASQLDGMHTFTCGFDMSSASKQEVEFDERSKAREFAESFGTIHHEKIINHHDMELSIPKIAWHLEEPRVGQSYPNYFAAQLARQNVTVVLSGAGGDELFAGYPWRYYRAVHNRDTRDYLDKYYSYWQRLVPESLFPSFFKPIWHDISDFSTKEVFDSIYDDSLKDAKSPADFVNQSLFFEAKTFLHGLLVVEDKLSMAHSLESRVPILDNDLVEFAMKIPARYKLSNLDKIVELSERGNTQAIESYFQRSADGKLIFRKSMERHLPKSVSGREKQGFSGPDASWFTKESVDFIRKRLINKHALIYNFVDFDTVLEILRNHFESKQNSRLLIWSLLNFEEWLCDHA